MMRRRILFALMISFLLAGCGPGESGEERFDAWRGELEEREVSFSGDVRVDRGDSVVEYSALLETGGEAVTVTVTAPEGISGLRLRTEDGGASLDYDGAVLELGDSLEELGLSPASALPAVLDALRTGYVESLGRVSLEGEEVLRADLLRRGGGEVTVWLLLDDFRPLRAELRMNGRTVLLCQITDWTTEG